MMKKNKAKEILIMGRPNVGKSTLVNRLLGRKQAITMDLPGVTRDLARYALSWGGEDFTIVDSGGVMFSDAKDVAYQDEIDAKVLSAIESAAVIFFLTDGKVGVDPQDAHIANLLRPYHEKVKLLVNKLDDHSAQPYAAAFYELGLGEPIAVSALNHIGLKELMGELSGSEGLANKANKSSSEGDDYEYKISIIGRPNVGKSSLLNAILNEDLLLVDNKAGTTRDAIPLYYQHENAKYLLLDTAGMRKKAKVEDGVEYYAVLRSKKSMHEADLVVFVTDIDGLMCEQDRKIIGEILESQKNMIMFINKWDQTDRTDAERRSLLKQAKLDFPALRNYPIIVGSAHEKVNFGKLFQEIPQVMARSNTRISTSQLNQFIEQVIKRNPPPAKKGHRVRIYYATQVKTNPPIFVFFINKPKGIEQHYMRFVENQLRAFFGGFSGCTISLEFRLKSSPNPYHKPK